MKKITLALIMSFFAVVGTTNMYAQTEGDFDFSKGRNYHLIYLDGESAAKIPASDIAYDYRPDDTVHFLYVWDETYVGNTASGPNSNGVPGAYLDFSVSNVGWSGLGFAGVEPGKDMTGINETYNLHVAFKSKGTESHAIIVGGGENKEAKFTIGSAPFNDGGVLYEVYKDFPRDGEWYYFDIPMSVLSKMGCRFTDREYTGNIFAMLSGGKQGTNICLDAIFFYQPKDVEIDYIQGETVEKIEVTVEKNLISVSGSREGIQLYDISGKLLKSTPEMSVGTEGISAGIYLVKVGSEIKKVLVR